MSNLLEEKDIHVGERYRGRNPIRVSSVMTNQIKYDDRYVTWTGEGKGSVKYYPINSTVNVTTTMKLFLEWVGRKMKREETSNVPKSQ